MRKNRFFNIFYVAIIFIYLVMLLLHTAQIYPFSYILSDFWFEIFLCFMGLVMFMRAILFKSDSSLFIGSALIMNSILFLIRNIYSLLFWKILPIIIFTFAISAILCYIFFKNKLYLKSFLIIILISLVCCNIYWFV